MPLANDATLYDLQAANFLRGGVLYRDLVETNLPGVIWIHSLVRWIYPCSSVALRAVDLALFSLVVLLIATWLRSQNCAWHLIVWVMAASFLLYFSVNESCHCQRDIWLLVPGLGALTLRRTQVGHVLAGNRFLRQTWCWAVGEGLCWGAGVWVKPMIIVPAAACWLVSAVEIGRWRVVLADLTGLSVGGTLIGIMGLGWLYMVGALPFFLESLINWDPEYFAARREYWTWLPFVLLVWRFFPWQFVHLAAVPVALIMTVRGLRRKSRSASRITIPTPTEHFEIQKGVQNLLAAFYLGWLVQAYGLQHLHDYVHLPGVLLAVFLLAGISAPTKWWKLTAIGFLGCALTTSAVIRPDRISCWWTCLTQGSSPQICDRLKLLARPCWQDLDRAGGYLRGLKLRNCELTCYDNNTIHLYRLLDLRPSTRFVYLAVYIDVFPNQSGAIARALADSSQRYVVSDLSDCGLAPEAIAQFCPEGPLKRTPWVPARLRHVFPWSCPVIYRAGPYLVHRVERPLGRLSP